jgi:ATP-binding cassette, subfamily C, bacterial CydC
MNERALLADLLDATGTGRGRLRLAAGAGALASISAVALLGLSGWFLASAALAGAAGVVAAQGFNYLVPSAAIRLLAILRTVGRYGERLLGHQAALEGMAALRTRLFARQAAMDSREDGANARRAGAVLLDDIAALEDIVIRRPAVVAGLAGAVAAVILTVFAGWLAALALATALAAMPVLLQRLAVRLSAEPAARLADAVLALRTAMTEFAEVRSEIAAYGLAPRISASLVPLELAHDQAKTDLIQAEARIGAVQSLYGAVVAALVLVLAEGAAPLIALSVLAASAGVEATAGLTRNAMRKAGIEKSLARLASLSRAEKSAQVFVPEDTPARAIGLGSTIIVPGARIAISGISGSGKTRLLEALAGLRPAVHALTVGDTPVSEIAADGLRRQFALVPQDAMLLAGTIADNLRIAAPGLREEAMWDALRIACLDHRIREAPERLDAWLSSDGGFLSGGERKRLALARALLARRPWLLLDEPTEGLDSATEHRVIDNLAGWLAQTGTGLILVSHRPNPLRLAHRIVSIGSL